ncbi:hypothetical protein B9Z55_013731 [Caenorhabditis nigoni]|uniref:G-protein coupled receptors family 1 profile domain-containing protein n=1 Tax=Caenorhabditis nigoni TaxID=1611254 RepID=A0A2G5U310_9PELO|nr:hypothetical protein B9Z55_013731 [Caenorhabditis nigoni]
MVSSKARSLQSQLYYALVFQIIIPTVLLNVPLAVFFVLTLLNRGPGEYSAYLSLLITLYPVIDPLPNFFIISPYRKAAFGCFQWNRQLSGVNQVPPNSKNVVVPANSFIKKSQEH